MIKKLVLSIALVALVGAGTAASAYDFWGISLGTDTYNGATCLTFNGVAGSGAEGVVGGYPYTQVDGEWQGPFAAATPGEGFLASRKSDAQGLFFKADAQNAYFVIIAGTPETGYGAPECGTGTRFFGPGDLKLDINGNTYGVGMRLGGLAWAIDPNSTAANLLVYRATGGVDSIYARDGQTLGDVELNPTWDRVGNQDLPADSNAASAFFVSGSGASVGTATVSTDYTGISIEGAGVYAYEVSVPLAALGLNSSHNSFTASWRPDCGNDLLTADFSCPLVTSTVPEPGTVVSLVSGVVGMIVARKRGP